MGRELRKRLWIAVCGAALLLSGAFSAQTAAAVDLHAFDPVLSLTGDCSESTLDPVPDPGLCPGVDGVDHPPEPFSNPKAVTTDPYGNIYVASSGPEQLLGEAGRIDIFDSSGEFITEITDENGPASLAVDSEGNLYVANAFDASEESLVRYEPTGTYEPGTGQIEYGDPPVVVIANEASGGIAINFANDHLFRKRGFQIIEYKSASEDNEVVGAFGEGELKEEPISLAIDGEHGRVYAGSWESAGTGTIRVVKVFDLASPHDLLFEIDGSEVPNGKFLSSFLSVAADEGTGHFFVYDGNAKKVYEFGADGKYLSTIEHGFQYTFLTQIGLDNGPSSPNGALNPDGRYLFVPSHPAGAGHSFAFGPSNVGVPEVEAVSVANVTETEVELRAEVEPHGLPTDYAFEYLTQAQFEEQGNSFTGAAVAGEGEIPAGNAPVDVTAAVSGLQPGTDYRFRIVVDNEEGSDEGEGAFLTYPSYGGLPACPSDGLRIGLSALLPDCRAYELVTPPDTNARAPRGIGHLGTYFPTREASPDGSKVSFQIEGGLIPGLEGTGALAGDSYLTTRGEGGWDTSSAGPMASESTAPSPGSTSPDQGFSFWTAEGEGSAFLGGRTTYVRYPDGHSALIGRGEIADDTRAVGRLISENGTHIIFDSGSSGSAVKLTEDAPPSGTRAVYDRTADEVTHVVSKLPGEVTPAKDEAATYLGASLDGRGIAFSILGVVYMRYENAETFELGDGVAFAGIAEGGNYAFYVEGGNLKRFNAENEAITTFTTTSDVTPVMVSPDGSTAYFVSPSKLPGGINPNGVAPVAGEENLYRSREGDIDFVGTVTERDVEGEAANEPYGGLGLWIPKSLGEWRLGAVPARTTTDGGVLLFESRASLDGYDPDGKAEIYRYDQTAGKLDCLSCNPTGVPATSDASLQSMSQGIGDPEPFNTYGYVTNLSSSGQRAFFQSSEALVPADSDGLQDVYEWEAEGIGSCASPGGCLYLISSGHSLRIDYLYAASDSGNDVFFRSSDILLPRDAEETPSIYDARVGGGFPEPVSGVCEGEGCRPGVTPTPALGSPGTPATGAKDNVKPKRCPKGKHKVRRGGKVRCVKKGKHRHRKAGTGKKEGAR